MSVVKEVDLVTQFCFALEIWALGKLILGNLDEPQRAERATSTVLTSYSVSSLVINNLGGQAGGRNVTLTGFYFDFAAEKEQCPTSALGSRVKQLVYRLEELPEEMSRTH